MTAERVERYRDQGGCNSAVKFSDSGTDNTYGHDICCEKFQATNTSIETLTVVLSCKYFGDLPWRLISNYLTHDYD